MYQERLGSYLKKMLQRDVTPYQIHLACCLKKLFQHIRNVFRVTSRRCYNVSGTPYKWLDEDVRMYQEHLAWYLAKMLHRKKKCLESYLKKVFLCIRNVLEVTWRRCYNEMLHRIRYISHVAWRSCSNISGMSSELLQEDVTTYQERLTSDLTKMSECIRNILQVSWRRCYTVRKNVLKVT